MPAILNATKGAENANTYALTSEADEFLDNIYGAGDWELISDDDKDRLLLTAARCINALPITFDKANASQKMRFPVDPATSGNTDGFDEAKEATILQAFYLLQNNDVIQEGLAGAIQGLQSESLGAISRTITGYDSSKKHSPEALQILDPFISSGA